MKKFTPLNFILFLMLVSCDKDNPSISEDVLSIPNEYGWLETLLEPATDMQFSYVEFPVTANGDQMIFSLKSSTRLDTSAYFEIYQLDIASKQSTFLYQAKGYFIGDLGFQIGNDYINRDRPLSIDPNSRKIICTPLTAWEEYNEMTELNIENGSAKPNTLTSTHGWHHSIYHLGSGQVLYDAAFISDDEKCEIGGTGEHYEAIIKRDLTTGETLRLQQECNYLTIADVNTDHQLILVNAGTDDSVRNEIKVLDYNGNVRFQKAQWDENYMPFAVDLSPDGNKILVALDRTSIESNIIHPLFCIIDIESGEVSCPENVVGRGYEHSVYFFTPDGNKVLFAGGLKYEQDNLDQFTSHLSSYDINTGEVEKISGGGRPHGFYQNFADKILVSSSLGISLLTRSK